jgi:tRNA1(Val) A37 N6-methylase TrmN6
LDNVNCDIVLKQEEHGLKYGTDAYLLHAFMPRVSKSSVCEGGCGSGIISLLLLKNGKCASAFCIDVQESSCEIAKNNALVNKVQDRMTVLCTDVLDYKPEHEFDAFVCNPPYMKENSGKNNVHTEKYIARHETTADIGGFAACAYRALKDGACAYFVYRPDRCADIICALKQNKLEPKVLTFVHATVEHEPCLMLIKAKKNAQSGMILTKPLIIYEGSVGGEYSSDMKYIYENAMFPSGFFR